MQTLEAYNHGNGRLTVFIRCQEHIDWLRGCGVECPLAIGDVILSGSDRRRVYPTISEAMQPAIYRYLEALVNDEQDSVALAGGKLE